MSSDIMLWLEGLGLGHHVRLFTENGIDLDVLLDLTEDDFKELGLSLGDRRRLFRAIHLLPGAEPTRASTGRAGPPERLPHRNGRPSDAERRQLTVMFCDLVGSTALSSVLDPEDMHELLRAYQETCANLIVRYDGYVARFMGDGVLAYFGYPQAHEDDAERAIHAALGIVEHINDAGASDQDGRELAVRIGIATGRVVVGDLIGEGASQEAAVTGETPNLAARLQAIADANQIVVAPSTHQLAGHAFDCIELEQQELKGMSQVVRPWSVRRAHAVESRFDAVRGANLTPLVGRAEQISTLVGLWDLVREGKGQVVRLCGESGIGKSRIAQTLRTTIADEPLTLMRYQCLPYYTNSPLHPIIAHLERVAGFARDDALDAKLDKLEAVLAKAVDDPSGAAMHLAPLMSLDGSGRYPPLDQSSQKQKEETLSALVGQVRGLARKQPVLLVFEDVHWIDPATQEVLDFIVSVVKQERVMLLITHRPEYQPQWPADGQMTLVDLSQLDHRQVTSMVETITGGKPLPRDVLDQIIAKTDGVPLFVEELTKTILESGLVEEKDQTFVLAGPLPDLAIPSTIQDSLMARLDRLESVKEVAQIGAVIGRDFSYEVVSAVSAMATDDLDRALAQLVESGLVFGRGTAPAATYTFKHVLIQETAYQSLLRARRRQLHFDIASTIEILGEADIDLAVLAHHWERAQEPARAVDYLEREAGRAFSIGLATQAVSVSLRGAGLLGVDLPTEPSTIGEQIGHNMERISELMAGRSPEELLANRALDDPNVEHVLSLLHRIAPHAFQSGQIELFALIAITGLRLTLEHGNGPSSAAIYSMYSVVHRGMTGDRATAAAWSQLAIDLDARHGCNTRARVEFVHGWFHNQWVNPLATNLALARDAAEAGFSNDDVLFACFNLSGYVVYLAALGRPLAEVMDKARDYIERNGNRVINAKFTLILELQVAKSLAGVTVAPLVLTDDEYDEERDLASICQTEFGNQIGHYFTSRAMLHTHFGDWQGALDWAERAHPLRPAFEGQIAEINLVQYETLAALGRIAESSGEPAEPLVRRTRAGVETMHGWAALCAANFAHKALLLDAVLEGTVGDRKVAAGLFDDSARQAQAAGFPHDAALAREFEARFHRRHGDEIAVRGALDAALKGYRAWGADGKVAWLMNEFGFA